MDVQVLHAIGPKLWYIFTLDILLMPCKYMAVFGITYGYYT